jgi:hypothetical protein
MKKWLQDRLEIIRLTFQIPALAVLFALLLLAPFLVRRLLPAPFGSWIPWTVWGMVWLVFLWFASIEYSLKRKEVFDQTSEAFFKAYLDHLIQEGHHLFNRAEEKDFHLRIGDWQRKAVEGIAIGLGPEESRKLFHAMDTQNPLTQAYKESQDSRSNEPLCRTLLGNLEELKVIQKKVAGPAELGAGGPDPVKQAKVQVEARQIEGRQ